MNADIAASVAKNTTFMMVSQGITWISSFILMLFLPRYLGTEEYGRLFLAISITMVLQMVIEYGGPYLVAKEVARERDCAPELLVNSLAVRAIMWVVSMIAMICFLRVAGYSSTVTSAVIILGTSKLWECAGKVLASGFQGFEMMQYPALGSIGERVCLAATGILALSLGASAVTIAVIMAACTFLNFGVIVIFTPRIVTHIPHVRWDKVWRLMKDGVPYLLWSVFAVVYYRIDAVMLSFMTPEYVVGWYGAAYRMFDIFMFLPSLFMSAVFPILSKLWGKDLRTLAGTTQKSVDCMLLAGLPLSILIFTCAKEIIEILFGLQGYAGSVILLRIFSVGLVLVYVDFVLISTLIAADKHRQWTISAFIAVLVNIILNYFLIPYAQTVTDNGGIGAAIATLGTEFAVMCMALYLLPKEIFLDAPITVSAKCLLAATGMALAIAAAGAAGAGVVGRMLAGEGVYALLIVLLKVFDPTELTFVRQFLSLRNLQSTLSTRTFSVRNKSTDERTVVSVHAEEVEVEEEEAIS